MLSTGRVWCWGSDSSGQLGDSRSGFRVTRRGLRNAEIDRDIRCAILTGAGDRHFCGGHNLAPRPNITEEEREYLRTQRIYSPGMWDGA